MSKVTKISGLALSTFLLSGCIASSFLDNGITESELSRWVATDTTDNIIAIGKPTTSIKGYENALALVGEKHNYLIQPVSGSDNLKQIFETVDLRYLTIELPTEKHIAVKQSGDKDSYYSCPTEYGCVWEIQLRFTKSPHQFFDKEKDKLKNLGFNCYIDAKQNQSNCYYTTYKIAFTATQKSMSNEKLNHRLKQPVPIVFYQFHPNKGVVGRAVRYALLPLAMAFDIVTFPIQMEMVDIRK